jgi:hypothetical protein
LSNDDPKSWSDWSGRKSKRQGPQALSERDATTAALWRVQYSVGITSSTAICHLPMIWLRRVGRHATSVPFNDTAKNEDKSVEKMGVAINFDQRTVSIMGYRARINEIDAGRIAFEVKLKKSPGQETFSGDILGGMNRVTGSLFVTRTEADPTANRYVLNLYSMFCKVTNRLF